jgi:hypothetical protein
MREDQINGQRDEEAAGEDGDSLEKGVEGVEGEAGEGSDCSRAVVDGMQRFIDGGVVEQTMDPVGEELVVAHVQQQVEDEDRSELEVVLHFGVVWIGQFNEADQRDLAEYVQEGPLHIV